MQVLDANAYFIQEKYANFFPEVPKDISKIYSAPCYYTPKKYGHPSGIRTVETIVNS